ncbi:hypothetical protein PF010_g16660 [Phytophthora fragariae]|uniref:MABP domain-containing protein n=1 Tax=Phytophthora fragariae TaxID=53985 RepID=A0A6G0KQD3_9STRA|nr:hypothetical protein PF010_g16660 [Phytophthora fragariae]
METAATMDVVVVFQRNEYYVSTQASADRSTLPVDLLQCQLLSLVGVLPDDQVLLSPSGEVLYSPSKADVATIAVPTEGRPRFFLLSSAESTAKGRGVATDWTQICTKSTFGNAAVVQPAFRKIAPSGGDPLATLICGPCTRTCTTGFQPVSPMEWGASKKMASRFISEIAVVTGDVDVAAPAGFTKLPGDLNYSASGDYVYLCVKRGDPNALTQLHVLFYQLDGESSSAAERAKEKGVYIAEKVVDVDCNSGGTARDGSGMCVRIGYDSVQLLGNKEQLETFGITDITVVVGDQPPPSAEYVKITRNLNEGAPGALPVFICYRLAPLGGFACNSSREHSEFGECLFATRHVTGIECVLDFDEQRLCFARTTLAAARRRGDEAIMEAHYRQHQSGMLGRLQSGLQRAQSYESRKMQEEALKRIPVDVLHERAQANTSPMPSYQDELVKQLLHWFKREFFTWMNQPRCSACSHDKTRSVRTEGPSTAEEIAGQASRVEVYQCPACGALTRFPRYNDPVKLLDTRTGRCGEWANCFTLCCRAMGFEARYVLDVTDHVWTEVYSEHFKRWLHCDSCEDQLDCPLTYEVGWGKKLSYIFSFAHDEVVDTARRYTQNWAEMRSRRQDVSETWLETTIGNMNRSLRERQTPERVAVLTARAKSEQEELRLGRSAQKTEVKGRVSGSAEWKTQRQEDGKQEVASSNATSTPTLTKTLNAVSPADILQTIYETLAFCAAMRENFVSAPPLRAFGPDGLRGDKTCAEAAAGAQSGYHVTRVLMWGGEFFYGLQFVYEKDTTGDAQSTSSTTVYGSLMGNATAKRQASQPTVTLELLPDEVVTRVSGRKGAWTDSITLHTNFGRTMTCGGNGGGDFSVSIPAKSEIRSISFKIGDHLTDAIAFVLEPSSTRTLGGDTMEILMKTLSSGDHSSRQKAISAALRYLENIAHQPEELKFKRIRASNKFFASNVGTLGEAAAKAFMRWCGFEEMSEQGEQFFVFQPAQQQVKSSPQRLSAEAHKRLHFLKNVGTH